jgi:hypothetical protein
MEDYRNSRNNLVQKPEQKNSSKKKPKNRWDYNIRKDRKKKIQREVTEWIHVAQHTDKWRERLKTVMDTVTQNGT